MDWQFICLRFENQNLQTWSSLYSFSEDNSHIKKGEVRWCWPGLTWRKTNRKLSSLTLSLSWPDWPCCCPAHPSVLKIGEYFLITIFNTTNSLGSWNNHQPRRERWYLTVNVLLRPGVISACLAPHSNIQSRNLPPALSQSAAAWCPLVISVTLDWALSHQPTPPWLREK